MREIIIYFSDPGSVSLIGLVFFTVLQGLAYYKQNRIIWKDRDVELISTNTFSFLAGVIWYVLVYGIAKSDPAYIFNAIGIAPFSSAILFAIWKFRGFTSWDKLFLCFNLSCVVVSIPLSLDAKEIVLSCFFIGGAIAWLPQWYALLSTGKRGKLCIEPVLNLCGMLIFWSSYGYWTDDWVLMWVCPVHFVLMFHVAWLWKRAKARTS